jgi:hypothetical protein
MLWGVHHDRVSQKRRIARFASEPNSKLESEIHETQNRTSYGVPAVASIAERGTAAGQRSEAGGYVAQRRSRVDE